MPAARPVIPLRGAADAPPAAPPALCLGAPSPRCVFRTLALVGAAAGALAAAGAACLADAGACPPPLNIFVVNGSSSAANASATPRHGVPANNDTGVGVLMLMTGASALVPVLMAAWIQCRGQRSSPRPPPHHAGGAAVNGRGHYRVEVQESDRGAAAATPAAPVGHGHGHGGHGHSHGGGSSTTAAPDGGRGDDLERKRAAVTLLFAAHFLSAWGDRMWQFLVPVLFMDIFIVTLWPTALYALVVYSACVQFMPAIGMWVDRAHRLGVQRFALIVDNASVVGTCALLCYLAVSEPTLGAEAPVWDTTFAAVFVGVLLLGVSGELMNQAQTLSVERDWVVVIAERMRKLSASASSSTASLADMNTLMRRIDLSCKVLAPTGVGLILGAVGDSARNRVFYGAAAVGLWNALAFPLELLLTTVVFHAFPELDAKLHAHTDGATKHTHVGGHKPHTHLIHQHTLTVQGREDGVVVTQPHWHDVPGPLDHVHDVYDLPHTHGDGDGGHEHDAAGGSGSAAVVGNSIGGGVEGGRVVMETAQFTGDVLFEGGKSGPCAALLRGFRAYFRHEVFLASLSLSALYCTVLDNGALMTAYLTWRGVNPAVLGSSRGAGAIFGLVGTVAFPALMRCTGGSMERAGLLSIWLFWSLLTPGLVAFYLAGESTATDYTVMGAMAVARIGLWSFDLAETQIMQEYIAEDQRGIINSTQTATYQLFYVLIQCAGIVLDKPQEFIVLVTFSIGVVLCACVCYTRWYGKIGAKHARARRRAESGGGEGGEGGGGGGGLNESLLDPGGASKRQLAKSELEMRGSPRPSPETVPTFKDAYYEQL